MTQTLKNEVRADLCNQTYYAKLTGHCKAWVLQQIAKGKVDTVEVRGGTKLIRLTAEQSAQELPVAVLQEQE